MALLSLYWLSFFFSCVVLRIPAMYEVNNSQICNFWTVSPVIQLINHLFFKSDKKPFQKSACPILQRWCNNRVVDQNIQKCCIFLMHSRYPLVHQWMHFPTCQMPYNLNFDCSCFRQLATSILLDVNGTLYL